MEQNTAKTPNRRRHSRYAAPVGGIYLVLMVIGLLAVIVGSIRLTTRLLDNSEEVEKLERMLLPVLMFDPVPFDSIENADPIFLLQSSLWSTLYSDKRESYTYDDSGLMVIPASDVDVAAAKLFGPNVSLQHQTFGDFQTTYVYDAANQVYRVPIMAQAGYYTPVVEEITNKGDYLELRVGYVASSNGWLTDTTGKRFQPTPDKYMLYHVKKENGEYYILAILDTGESMAPVTSSSQGQ